MKHRRVIYYQTILTKTKLNKYQESSGFTELIDEDNNYLYYNCEFNIYEDLEDSNYLTLK